MKKSTYDYIKYITTNKNNLKIICLIFFLLFVHIAWQFRLDIPKVALLGINIHDFTIFKFETTTIKDKIVFGFCLLILPILFVTAAEILNLNSRYNFKNISLMRLIFSEESRYEDILYFSFTHLLHYVKFLTIFATLGFSVLSENFNNFLNNFYNLFLPIKINYFIDIFIFIIAILVLDFTKFIIHYLSHIVPIFWDLHELHHSSNEMNYFAGQRVSLLDEVIQTIPLLPLQILSLAIVNHSLAKGDWLIFVLYTFYVTVGSCTQIVGHSSLKMIYPKPLSYIFMSPSLHWIHHSTNPKYFNKNIGLIFTFWDKAFGTFLDESHLKDIQSFGVKNSDYNKFNPFYNYFCIPIIKIIKRFKFFKTSYIN